VFTVEGWGAAAAKAPLVEEFHQWQLEAEGLQRYLSRVIHLSLIEPFAVLEVYEDTEERKSRKQMRVAIQLDPMTSSPMMGPDGEPMLVSGPDGRFIEAMDDLAPSAEVVVDSTERVRNGPAYRVIPYRDFLILPAWASDRTDIWGYAKRFVRTVGQLQERAEAGVYDPKAVEAMGTHETAESTQTDLAGRTQLTGQNWDPQTTPKDLWEVLFLRDFGTGDGRRWYVATIGKDERVLLRLQHDDIGGSRYIPFTPFPRPDRAIEGYSFVGHKLITVVEEHSAWRNMLADRAALVVQTPLKRLDGALWDPEEQPWGPKAVIDVRSMDEVQAFSIPDFSSAAIEREAAVVSASERLAGINDVALGVRPQEGRTLGEVNLVAEQSFVRIEETIKNLQESLEEVAQVRHLIWKRTLAERPEGLPMPDGLLIGLEQRGVDMAGLVDDGKMTAQALDGTFRFKPRGSVETADVSKQRNDFVQFLGMIPQLMQTWPAIAQLIGANPAAARSVLEQALRLFRFPDRQAILGSNVQQAPMAMPPGMPPLPMLPGQPGVPGQAPPGPPPVPQGPPPPAAPF